jgi:hypothetical protein
MAIEAHDNQYPINLEISAQTSGFRRLKLLLLPYQTYKQLESQSQNNNFTMANIATQQFPQALPYDLKNSHSVTSQPVSPLLEALPALKQQLSEKAAVRLSHDEAFGSTVQRSSEYKRLIPGAAVCPAAEADIISTVTLADPLWVLLHNQPRHTSVSTDLFSAKN